MEPCGFGLSIAGILIAFKGAVDSYVVIEQLFRKDCGLQDRMRHSERLRKEFEEWGAVYEMGPNRRPDECLIYYVSAENREEIAKILDCKNKLLDDIKKLLEKHTSPEQPRRRWRDWLHLNRRDGSKNRASWVFEDQQRVDEILKHLEEHLKNLAQCAKDVSCLKGDTWKRENKGKLTSVDEKKSHSKARDFRLEGTCKWFFKRKEYHEWISGATSNLLWINATPGNGKTVLASAIIDELAASRLRPRTGLAYFYCDYNDTAHQSLPELFGCMSAQLAEQSLLFRNALSEYMKTFEQSYLGSRTVQYEELANIMVKVSKEMECIYLVIDAADEFLPPGRENSKSHEDNQQRNAFLKTLMMLQRHGMGRIKIVLTSRPMAQIQSILDAVPKVTITSEANREDIRLYVQSNIDMEKAKGTEWGVKITEGESQSPSTASQIITSILEKADGMFLFASLQTKILLYETDTSKDISIALAGLPSTIAETWELLLLNIDKAQELDERRQTIKKLLQWLVAAIRPLTLLEIRAAIALRSYEVGSSIAGNLDHPQSVLKLCGPLVRLSTDDDPNKRELSLAHFSLKEYLVSGKLSTSQYPAVRRYDVPLSEANAYLATVSLTYLSSQELSQPFHTRQDLDRLRQEHKLLDYATIHGGEHLLSLDRSDDKIIELLNGLLVPEVSWGELGMPNVRPNTLINITFTAFPPPNLDDDNFVNWPAHWETHPDASRLRDTESDIVSLMEEKTLNYIKSRPNNKLFLQLFRILSFFPRKDHPVNVTPLYFAALFGWKPGVQQLLETNQGRFTKSDLNHALRAAAVGGFPGVINLLCRSGADVNVHIGPLGSPLQSTTACGKTDAFSELLKLGADTTQDFPFYRPEGTVGGLMQAAAEAGNTNLMQILIDRGGDINCNAGWLGTPLQSVIEKGKLDIARWIIGHPNFDPNVTGGYYGSASRELCTYSHKDHPILLEAVLDRGGSPSERVGPYGSLLEISSHFGLVDRVQLLLKRGAELDGTSMGQFGNAIHAAAMCGDEKILGLLLERNADPNCPGRWLGEGMTDLEAYDEYGKVLMLIQGTGFLAYPHSWVTKAFFAPAMHASLRVAEIEHNKVFFLFENEPTHRETHFGNPLQGAAFRGKVGAMQLLLKKGARIDARAGFFGTALQAAASQNHLEAVETLLESDANPNVAPGGYYGSALSAATALGFPEIIQALVNRGARDDLFDDDGWSARTWRALLSPDPLTQTPLQGECRAPSAWSTANRSPKLTVSGNGLDIEYRGSLSEPCTFDINIHWNAATVLSNHPCSPYADFYFEISIKNKGNTGIIAIGVSELFIPTFKLPGHSKPSWGFRGDDHCFAHKREEGPDWPHGASWGFRGDDGLVYAEQVQQEMKEKGSQEKKEEISTTFSTGDIVGCGIERGTEGKGVIFWTKNGLRLEPDIKISGRRLYPAVGLQSQGAAVRANFGATAFRYEPGNHDVTNRQLNGFGALGIADAGSASRGQV